MMPIRGLSELFTSYHFSPLVSGSGRKDMGTMAQVEITKPAEQPGIIEKLNELSQKNAAEAAEKIRVANVAKFVV